MPIQVEATSDARSRHFARSGIADGTVIPALDGLRAFACLIVLASHSGNLGFIPRIAGAGQLGVMMFFSLSGFLMAVLYGDGSRGQQKRWMRFEIRRFFRVYPPYICIVLIGFAIGIVVPSFVYAMGGYELYSHLVLKGTISVFWTIPVEMRFYLLFPLLCIFAEELGKLWGAVLYGLIAVLFILVDPSSEKYQLWPYVEFFALGCCAANIYRLEPPRKSVFSILGFALLLVIVFSIPRISSTVFGIDHRLWKAAWFYAPIMALTVLSSALSTGALRRVLSARWMRWVGKISFSLYLVHLPVLHFVRTFVPPEYALLPAFVLSLLVAWVCYRMLEVPSQRLGRSFEKRLMHLRLKGG